MNRGLKIGELAKLTGCPVETIRYYEHQGLIAEPERSEGNYRMYGEAHIDRLQFIRHCRLLDMTLEEVGKLLRYRDAPEEDCWGANVLLDEHIGHVAARIDELKLLQTHLEELRGLCHKNQAAKNCKILQSLAAPPAQSASSGSEKNGPRPGRLHKTHR